MKSLFKSISQLFSRKSSDRAFYQSRFIRRFPSVEATRTRQSTVRSHPDYEIPRSITSTYEEESVSQDASEESIIPRPIDHNEITPTRPILKSKRCGLPGTKIGVIGLYDEWGQKHLCTIIAVREPIVMRVKTIGSHGYEALSLASGSKSVSEHNRRAVGRYMKVGCGFKKLEQEFRVSADCLLPIGTRLSVRHFVPGQWLFVTGFSKEKGFEGVVKRYGFAGDYETMGTTKGARKHGSTGRRGDDRVFKFKKMAGHMGPDPRVVNCQLFQIDAARELLFLKGTVPGDRGASVRLFDARGKTSYKNVHIKLPYPTFIPREGMEYPVIITMPPPERDPFAHPDRPIYEKRK